jgi:hypothetical protein
MRLIILPEEQKCSHEEQRILLIHGAVKGVESIILRGYKRQHDMVVDD